MQSMYQEIISRTVNHQISIPIIWIEVNKSGRCILKYMSNTNSNDKGIETVS